jgi:hypothetical protein
MVGPANVGGAFHERCERHSSSDVLEGELPDILEAADCPFGCSEDSVKRRNRQMERALFYSANDIRVASRKATERRLFGGFSEDASGGTVCRIIFRANIFECHEALPGD